MTTFPSQPDQLTSEFFTTVLRSSGDLGPHREVTNFRSSTIGDGMSILGLVQRVELDYSEGDGPAGPTTVIAKFATPVEANRAIAMNTRMYQREVDFFHDIAPTMEMPLTKCYFATIDTETGDFVVVLEDLRNYRAGDQISGISADEAKLIIDSFAPLNAAYFGKVDQPLLADCMRIDTSYRDLFLPGVFGTWEMCRDKFPHFMTPEVLEALPRYIAAMSDLHRMMGERTQTLVHGDVRLDNVMFGSDPAQHPIVLIDWQAIMISNPMQDVAYMVSQSMETDIRRECEEDLIAHARDALTAHGVEGYTLEQARSDYDVAVLWIMCYPLIIGGVCDPANERSLALAEKVLRRSTATVTDRNLLALLP